MLILIENKQKYVEMVFEISLGTVNHQRIGWTLANGTAFRLCTQDKNAFCLRVFLMVLIKCNIFFFFFFLLHILILLKLTPFL